MQSNLVRLNGVPLHSLFVKDNIALTSPFLLEELDEVVVKCDDNKSPGPGAFIFSFLRRLWKLLRGDLGIMLVQIHRFESLPYNFASCFITMIPKVYTLSQLADF